MSSSIFGFGTPELRSSDAAFHSTKMKNRPTENLVQFVPFLIGTKCKNWTKSEEARENRPTENLVQFVPFLIRTKGKNWTKSEEVGKHIHSHI